MSKMYNLNLFKSNGVALIELLISLMFLVPLLLVTVEMSHALYEYQTLVKQVRAGARFLTTQPTANHSLSIQPHWVKAKCLVRLSTLNCSDPNATPILSNLTDAMILISDSQCRDSTCSDLPSNFPNPNLFAVQTDSSSLYSTTVNLIKVSVEGYRHNFISGMPTISFPPVSLIMRQSS